jgi:hypothetical protein
VAAVKTFNEELRRDSGPREDVLARLQNQFAHQAERLPNHIIERNSRITVLL